MSSQVAQELIRRVGLGKVLNDRLGDEARPREVVSCQDFATPRGFTCGFDHFPLPIVYIGGPCSPLQEGYLMLLVYRGIIYLLSCVGCAWFVVYLLFTVSTSNDDPVEHH